MPAYLNAKGVHGASRLFLPKTACGSLGAYIGLMFWAALAQHIGRIGGVEDGVFRFAAFAFLRV